MCDEPLPVPLYRDPALRERAAALRAGGAEFKHIATALGVGVGTAKRLLAPVPDFVVPDAPKPVTCRRCATRPASRPKGLCWTCSFDPAIRTRYAPISKYGRRGIGHARRGRRAMPAPISAPAGSQQKIEELRRRAEAGEELHHPRDWQFEVRPERVEVRICSVARNH